MKAMMSQVRETRRDELAPPKAVREGLSQVPPGSGGCW